MSPVQIATEIAGNHSRLMGKLKAVSRDGLHMTLGDGRKLEVAYVGYSAAGSAGGAHQTSSAGVHWSTRSP